MPRRSRRTLPRLAQVVFEETPFVIGELLRGVVMPILNGAGETRKCEGQYRMGGGGELT